ncbi:MAG: HAD family hydrolase [Caldilineaceae bacterium]
MMLSTILFDLDDTLHDKRASLAKCGARLYAEHRLNQYANEVDFLRRFIEENCIIQPKEQVFDHLAAEFGIDQTRTAQLKEAFDQTFQHDATLFLGVMEALEFLAGAGVSIGCVTNGRDFFQRNKIEALGIEPFLDAIVTSGGLGIKKPDHRIFHTALQQLGAVPKQTIFCGDSLNADLKPAHELGMTTIWKADEKNAPEYVNYVLPEFSDFQNLWQTITA